VIVCDNCGAENADAQSYCHSCGAKLDADSNTWPRASCGIALIAVFAPVGLCGLFYSVELQGNDPYGFMGIAAPSLVIGIALTGLGVYFLKRR
jgi:hypothetical protein